MHVTVTVGDIRNAEHNYMINNKLSTPKPKTVITVFEIPFNIYNYSSSSFHHFFKELYLSVVRSNGFRSRVQL